MGASLSSIWASLPPPTDFFPPSPAAYTILLTTFQYFPICTIFQWLLPWHPAGKTSLQTSFLNIPGRIAWSAMEIVGPINLIYNLSLGSPSFSELPAANQLVAALYCIHYFNRGIISPFFSAPSMSPIHASIMTSAMVFNWLNSSCIAGWLHGYAIPMPGFKTDGSGALASSSPSSLQEILPLIGVALFILGMAGNIYSETALFRFRKDEAEKRAAKKSDSQVPAGDDKYHKVYVIPPVKGVFRSILYPHYVFEWIEWTGFALAGTAVFPLSALAKTNVASAGTGVGVASRMYPAPWVIPAVWAADKYGLPLPLPAVLFVINAVANMLPHARWGRKWYVEKFGEKGVAGRGAVVPWCSWM
ncbi:hypothetical protein PENDEC_c012G03259 [Penicillium decumbens]|uniref:3-oxo-5-alpha-steroid 4-dehydrogenase C-terminal domain-containing protein n=1 Tax=Penicillium decumbens TaxID=69771 RepID=A0A1V6PAW5_PENDC|nr:hypothetical protein PENDEC_c012G03259 [Penicillium decumbens]